MEAVKESLQTFGWSDYTVFITMLVSCIGIGLYFSRNSGENAAMDYLLGGQRLGLIPISMSMIASAFTGIGFLGNGTEVYLYGSGFLYTLTGLIFVGVSLHFWILPVFHELRLVSMFEYLDRRFKSRCLRLFGSSMYLLSAVSLHAIPNFKLMSCLPGKLWFS